VTLLEKEINGYSNFLG